MAAFSKRCRATATTAQEQAIIRSKARGALALVWDMLGRKDGESAISQMPELVVDWDEASCTQLVYLYSELTQKFEGRIDRFLELKGRERAGRPSLRLACVDIGGGTTDLMVVTYTGEDNRVLHPVQNFREGFRVAGDDGLAGGGEGGDGFHGLGLRRGGGDGRKGQGGAGADEGLNQRRRLGDGGVDRVFGRVEIAGDAGDDFGPFHRKPLKQGLQEM